MLPAVSKPLQQSLHFALRAAGVIVVVSGFVLPARAQHYSIAEFGTLEDPGSSTVLRRMNATDEIVGGYKGSNPHRSSASFILSSNGFDDVTAEQSTDYSALYGINDSGEVAGSINLNQNVRPFRSVRHKQFLQLPVLPGDSSGAAYGINKFGEAVGYSGGDSGDRAVWWTRKGAVSQLESPPTSSITRALDVNQKGDIVGSSGTALKTAVLWPRKGSVVELGRLPGFTGAEAVSINNNGDVVGFAVGTAASPTQCHAVLWGAGGLAIEDLGTLADGDSSRASDIGDGGEVVGTSNTRNGHRAFLWTASTGMVDLNTLVSSPSLILVEAISINKNGAILALAVDASMMPAGLSGDMEEHDKRHILVLTPTS